MKWAGLASGTGSNLAAMYALGLMPNLVVVDTKCRAQEEALSLGIPCHYTPRRGKFLKKEGRFDQERVAYTLELINQLNAHDIELIVMAGWMTVFPPQMFRFYAGRVLNIHPALLPHFKGDHAVRDALAAGVPETGTTVHIATERLDDGPILAQRTVPILNGDTEDDLHERIKVEERKLYPTIVSRILSGSIDLDKEYQQWLIKQAV